MHLTLGRFACAQSQAVFYALAFFWLDGFAVSAPAQVTQTVGTPLAKHRKIIRHGMLVAKINVRIRRDK